MKITWQVAPHVYLNADSSGSVYCALTGRASCRAGSLLLHGWAFIELGLNVERLTPPLFMPPARSWGVKDVKRTILVGLVRNQGSQLAWKGKGVGSGAGQKTSLLAPCTSLGSPAPRSCPGVLLPLKGTVSIPRTTSWAFLPSRLLCGQTTCSLSVWALCLMLNITFK